MDNLRWEYRDDMDAVVDIGAQGMVAVIVLPGLGAKRSAGAMIAAAPELLAACEASSAVVEHEGRCAICAVLPGGCEASVQLRYRAAELRGAAIAKAKGAP